MEIRFYLCSHFSLFIILIVSEFNAIDPQQGNVDKCCGKPAQGLIPTIPNEPLFYDESPWMVAMLNKLRTPPEFLCKINLLVTR